MTQIEIDAVVGDLDATVTWDEGHGRWRIEPGQTMTRAEVDDLMSRIPGSYGHLDHTTPVGREELDAVGEALRQARSP